MLQRHSSRYRGLSQTSRHLRLQGEALEFRQMLAGHTSDDFANVPDNILCVLAPELPQTATIEIEGDTDVFSFDAERFEFFSWDVVLGTLNSDVKIQVLNAAGDELARAFGKELDWQAPDPGQYYIAVSSSVGTGTYDVILHSSVDVSNQPFSTHALRDPVTLQPGEVVTEQFEYLDDTDVFVVNGEVGDSVRVDIARGSIASYPSVRVYVDKGRQTPVVAPMTGSTVSFKLASDRPHFVSVSSELSNDLSLLGTYSVGYDVVPDDHADTANETVEVLTLGRAATGVLEVNGDRDVFAMDAIAGQRYQVSLFDPSHPNREYASLIRGSVSSENGVKYLDGLRGTKSFVPSQSERVLIEVSGIGGPYDVLVTTVDDDHVDEIGSDASRIGVGMTVSAEFEHEHDVDVFVIDAPAGTSLRATLSNDLTVSNFLTGLSGAIIQPHWISNLSLEFVSAEGEVLQRGPAQLSMQLQSDGPHYLRVADRGSTGPYTLHLAAVADDYPSSPNSALPKLQLGEPFSGRLEVTGDKDSLLVDLHAGQRYYLDGNVESAQLFQTDGTLLPTLSKNWRPAVSGPHRLEISGGAGATYRFTLREAGFDDRADWPNDQVAGWPTGQTVASEFERAHDTDLLSFEATAGEVLEFRVESGNVASMQILTLDGTVVPEANFSDDVLRWKVSQTGKFFVSFSGSEVSSYTASQTVVGHDDHVDIVGPGATTLNVGETRALLLETPQDRDVFAFEARLGELFRVNLQAAGVAAVESHFATLPPDVSFTDVDTEAGAAWRSPVDGTAYLVLSAGEQGAFEFEVESLGVDEADSPQETQGVVPLDEVVAGKVDYLSDVDVFAFDAVLGEKYRFDLESSISASARIVSDKSDNSWSPTSSGSLWTPPTSGRYYVGILGHESVRSGDYDLTIRRVEVPQYSTVTPQTLSGEFNAFSIAGERLRPIQVSTSAVGDSGLPWISVQQLPSLQFVTSVMDSQLLFVPPEDGEYVIVLSRPDGEVIGDFEVTVEVEQDDHPNSIGDGLTRLTAAQSIEANLSLNADVDVFTVDASEGEVWTFAAEMQSASSAQLRLVNDAGQHQAFGWTQLAWRPPKSGTYYLDVYGAVGDYTLSATTVVDDYPDDRSHAHLISKDELISGTLSTSVDVDVFAVDAEAFETFDLKFHGNLPSSYRVLVQNENGLVVHDGRVSGWKPTLRWKVQDTGRHFVQISGNASTDYLFSLTAADDDYPDTPRVGIPPVDKAAILLIEAEVAGDRDVLGFDAQQGAGFRFETSGRSVGRKLRILTPSGTELALIEEEIGYWTAPETGRYFAEFSNRYATSYTFLIQPLSDDHPNTASDTATIVTTSQSVPGSVEAFGDVDVFAFDTDAGKSHQLTLTSSQQFTGAWGVRVLSPSGETLASGDGGLGWQNVEAGRYYIAVDGHTQLGTYTLQVTSNDDDHANAIDANPTVVTVGAEVPGEFETDNDVDVFAVDLEKDVLVRLTFDRHAAVRKWGIELEVVDAHENIVRHFDTDEGLVFVTPSTGRYFFRLRSHDLGDYLMTVEPFGIDEHPSSPSSNALVLTKEHRIESRYDYPDDFETFAVDTVAGTSVTIEYDHDDICFVDAVIRNPDEEIVHQTSIGRKHQITWVSAESGRHWLTLQGYCEGDYELTLTEGAEAASGSVVAETVQIEYEQRVRFVELKGSVAAGDMYTRIPIELSEFYSYQLPPNWPITRLLREDGREVALPRDGSDWTVNSGLYFIEVSNRFDLQWKRSFAFKLYWEPDASQQPGEGTDRLTLGEPITRQFQGVIDVLAFDVEEAGEHTIAFDTSGPLTRPSFRILAGDGVTQLSQGGNSWRATKPGRYYIELTNSDSAQYRLTVTPPADDAPVSVSDPPTKLDLSFGSRKGHIERPFGVDVYTFDAKAGEVAEFSVRAQLAIRVLAADQSVLATGSQGKLVWKAATAGTYYLEVGGNQYRGSYSLGVASAFDDHPDRPNGQNKRIELASPEDSEFEHPGDVDVFLLDANQDITYQFDVMATKLASTPKVRVITAGGSTAPGFVAGQPWKASATGRFYVEVSTPVRTGEYRLLVDESL